MIVGNVGRYCKIMDFFICHLRHEFCSLECIKQTPVNEKNAEVLLKCLASLRYKYKLNSGVFNS